jgi:tRNA1Val (adenine37-N6)-methyltransferase
MSVNSDFRFKKFVIGQQNCTMKVNTDGVLLGAWSDVENKQKAIDIGTGTGIIALMLAQRNPQIKVDALEIHQKTFDQAKHNIKVSTFKNQIKAIHSSVQEFATNNISKYDLAVSNPPYFSGGIKSFNPDKSIARHTDKLSHHDLLFSVQLLLSQKGHFDVILPCTEGKQFELIARFYNLHLTKSTDVKTMNNRNIERVLMRFSKEKVIQPQTNQLIIHRNSGVNQYSDEFIALTKDFYLFM